MTAANPVADDSTPAGKLLCLGLGYTARALAIRLARRGFSVTGTSRTEKGAAALAAAGWHALVLDDGECPPAAVVDAVGNATHILLSAPPDGTGDPLLRALGGAISAAGNVAWIGYLSTVGVYGDRAGAWVDETTPPTPESVRSRRRRDAEAAWRELAVRSSLRLEVFRLPGIYGPGRSAIDSVQAGSARRIVKPGQIFNRMHVDDIAAALDAALSGPSRYPLYNLCDDEPAPPEDVVAYAAMLLGRPIPPAVPFDLAEMSPMARSFYGEAKRVSNRRMKDALGVTLSYPTYREGLDAIARAAEIARS